MAALALDGSTKSPTARARDAHSTKKTELCFLQCKALDMMQEISGTHSTCKRKTSNPGKPGCSRVGMPLAHTTLPWETTSLVKFYGAKVTPRAKSARGGHHHCSICPALLTRVYTYNCQLLVPYKELIEWKG